MLKNNEIVAKRGIGLYDGVAPYNVWIVGSSIRYGSHDYDDPPEIREDRNIKCFYVRYEAPDPPGPAGRIKSGVGPFTTLDEAIAHVVRATNGTIQWQDDQDPSLRHTS